VPNTFIHGKLSTVTIATTQFAGLTISYDHDLSDLTDITYTQAGGATWAVFLPGYNVVSGDITFVFDTSNPPYLSPQNMTPGTLMALVVSPDGVRNFSFNAYSGKFHWGGGPRGGPVNCSTHFQATGTVTLPVT
jgi:hypothetical protein